MSLDARDLLDPLRAAQTFESAAEALLRPLLQVTATALEGERGGRVLRGMVHLRPDRGYAGLHVLDARESDRKATPGPSATAWQRLQGARHPLVVDVETLTSWTLAGEALQEHSGSWGKSRAAIQARSVTHLGLWPLRAPGGGALGMVSVEIRCPFAVGLGPPTWEDLGEAFQRACDLAAPYLVALPLRTSESPLTDPMLPVVGATMAPIVQTLGAFSSFDETLLLRGATGTGKSHLARWCHAQSPRSDKAFEVAELHSVAATLQSGELFGWVKGAFTGAVRTHRGWVERAEGGTLFLDEIDKLDLETQGKLLSLLEERRYKPVGSETTRRANVRFVVGTNADLETLVREGRFLRDLYYRINVLPVELPPLTRRPEEIGPWAHWMVQQVHGSRVEGGRVHLSANAETTLRSFAWPGNLRQLNSVVVRAYAFASVGELGRFPLELELRGKHIARALAVEGGLGGDESLGDLLEQAAEIFVQQALQREVGGGERLPIELAEAFPGFVLEAAVRAKGSERDAFLLFGLESRLKGGNHLKTLRRERSKVEALLAAMGDRRREG